MKAHSSRLGRAVNFGLQCNVDLSGPIWGISYDSFASREDANHNCPLIGHWWLVTAAWPITGYMIELIAIFKRSQYRLYNCMLTRGKLRGGSISQSKTVI